MYTTTALVALRDYIAAPCPHCGSIVLVRLGGNDHRDHADAGHLPHGTGKCRSCGEPLTAASIRIPRSCWQDEHQDHGDQAPMAGESQGPATEKSSGH